MAEAVPPSADLDDEDRRRLDHLAARVKALGLEMPARFAVESLRPLQFLASQSLIGLRPLLSMSDPVIRQFVPWDGSEWYRFANLLEKRGAASYLLGRLEEDDEAEHQPEDEAR